MLHHLARLCLLMALLLSAPASFALNENTTIVLHARDGFAPCDDPQQHGIDCVSGLPNVDLSGMQMPWVYVMLRNYEHIGGLQCAFDWPSTWAYFGAVWNCQGHALGHGPTGPGPIAGTLGVAFDCVQGGALITVGQLIFTSTVGGGCVSVIESGFGFGTHVGNCDGSDGAAISPANRGRVCVGVGGYDACWPASTPVESATWGAIKSQYR